MSGYWDFECAHDIAFNTDRALPSVVRKLPQPEVELKRADELRALRDLYEQLCQRTFAVSAPTQSFDRWLLGMLIVPSDETTTSDPVLRAPETAYKTDVLKRELLNVLPASSYVSWSQRRSAAQIATVFEKYIAGAERWFAELNSTVAAEHLEAARQKLQQHRGDANMLYRVLTDVGRETRPLLEPLLQDKLRVVMEEFSAAARAAVTRISDVAIAASAAATDAAAGADDTGTREVVSVRTDERRGVVEVQYRSDVQVVKMLHYGKLRALQRLHNPDQPGEQADACLYVLLRRYATLFGPNVFESATMHAALPGTGFSLLRSRLGVCHENFASPLNCYFARFNSAFPDTDGWFGSHGSFGDFVPVEGSFETGPPYTEEVMEIAARRVEMLLSASERPLSFIVFVPDWRNPLASSLALMEASKYLRGDIVVPGRQHSYVVGHQHVAHERARERFFVLPFDTHVYVLQNDAGAARWPLGDTLQVLLSAMTDHTPAEQTQQHQQQPHRQGQHRASVHSRLGPREEEQRPQERRSGAGAGGMYADRERERKVSRDRDRQRGRRDYDRDEASEGQPWRRDRDRELKRELQSHRAREAGGGGGGGGGIHSRLSFPTQTGAATAAAVNATMADTDATSRSDKRGRSRSRTRSPAAGSHTAKVVVATRESLNQ